MKKIATLSIICWLIFSVVGLSFGQNYSYSVQAGQEKTEDLDLQTDPEPTDIAQSKILNDASFDIDAVHRLMVGTQSRFSHSVTDLEPNDYDLDYGIPQGDLSNAIVYMISNPSDEPQIITSSDKVTFELTYPY